MKRGRKGGNEGGRQGEMGRTSTKRSARRINSALAFRSCCVVDDDNSIK